MHVSRSRSDSIDVWTRRITLALTLFIRWFSAHWLLMANLATALYAGLPILAPLLMHAGQERAATPIYWVFKLLCHQLPERSFFVFGRQWAYSYQELSRMLGGSLPLRYVGNAEIGYKVAVCQRCQAIYLAMFLSGLFFACVRHWMKPLPFKAFGLMLVPLGIDGLGQLFGLWVSSWQSRLITGGLFGLACVWLFFPYLAKGMQDISHETLNMLEQRGE